MPLADCTILLVRHAHVAMAGRFCGSSDPSLSALGLSQLHKLAETLTHLPLTHIFSSDLRRAQQTANFIAVRAWLPVECLPELREMQFGEWEGLDWEQVCARDAAYAERWMAEYPRLSAPGGEHFEAFRTRVRAALAEVVTRTAGGCAAVVTHGGVVRTILLDVLALPESSLAGLSSEYASCIELRLCDGHWRIISEGGLRQQQTNS